MDFRHAFDSLGRSLDLRDAGQEGEQIAFRLFGERPTDCRRHLVLDPLLGCAADMAQFKRLDAALALDHRRSIQQRSEARAIQCRRHRHDPQIGPQPSLRIQHQRQPEIAVEAALMHFVEQHGGHAGQFRVILYPPHENALGQHQQAGLGARPAIHPRRIADRAARLLAHQFGDPLRRCACRQPARRKHQHLPIAPGLIQQSGCNRRGLARPRRRHQHGVAPRPQGGEQVGQHGMNGQVGHAPLSPGARRSARRRDFADPHGNSCAAGRFARTND